MITSRAHTIPVAVLSSFFLLLLCSIASTGVCAIFDVPSPSSPLTVLPSVSDWEIGDFMPLTWSAPFLSGGGYCSEAISFAKALAPIFGEKLSIMQHGDSYNGKFLSGLDQDTMKTLYPLQRNPHGFDAPSGAIHICHSEPGAWHPARYSTSRCPHARAAIKIGRTMFETDRLPSGWADRLNQMHFVWVPTHFHQRIFVDGGVDSRKVIVMPEPVDTDFYDPAKVIEPFVFPFESPSDSRRPFRFLSIFKFEDRKGWEILVRTFTQEFAIQPTGDEEADKERSEAVALYILTAAYHSQSDFKERIQVELDKIVWPDGVAPAYLPPIRLIESGLATSLMPALYAGSDAFVLPSRGEGWGRPHVEAMAMAKPVIATLWSGPSEFMTEENSYPLRHERLVEIKKGAFRGHKWAEPSASHLRELMRSVVADSSTARLKGERARQDMVDKYCQPCIAKLVVAELARAQNLLTHQQKEARQRRSDQETNSKDVNTQTTSDAKNNDEENLNTSLSDKHNEETAKDEL